MLTSHTSRWEIIESHSLFLHPCSNLSLADFLWVNLKRRTPIMLTSTTFLNRWTTYIVYSIGHQLQNTLKDVMHTKWTSWTEGASWTNNNNLVHRFAISVYEVCNPHYKHFQYTYEISPLLFFARWRSCSFSPFVLGPSLWELFPCWALGDPAHYITAFRHHIFFTSLHVTHKVVQTPTQPHSFHPGPRFRKLSRCRANTASPCCITYSNRQWMYSIELLRRILVSFSR